LRRDREIPARQSLHPEAPGYLDAGFFNFSLEKIHMPTRNKESEKNIAIFHGVLNLIETAGA
jgi:hypothetical protein